MSRDFATASATDARTSARNWVADACSWPALAMAAATSAGDGELSFACPAASRFNAAMADASLVICACRLAATGANRADVADTDAAPAAVADAPAATLEQLREVLGYAAARVSPSPLRAAARPAAAADRAAARSVVGCTARTAAASESTALLSVGSTVTVSLGAADVLGVGAVVCEVVVDDDVELGVVLADAGRPPVQPAAPTATAATTTAVATPCTFMTAPLGEGPFPWRDSLTASRRCSPNPEEGRHRPPRRRTTREGHR
ncbi:MAG TPA: hypothetical protein VGK60_04900 [Pedococcus sp.]|jgi:hypothetical protein